MQASEHLEKRNLNQLAPISRLYPEIFSIIFSQVRDSTISGSDPSLWAWHRTKEWIGLTHVCHAWGDIAVNTPTLWTKVFISVEDNLEWVQELLRRSKQCPLSILVSKPPESALSASGAIDPILQELKNDMHRFRELKLLDIPIDDLPNFFSNSHTHRLEYLHIIPYRNFSDTTSDTTSDSSSSDTPSTARFTLNDDVLRVDSLRRLSIENCGLDFYSPFLRSLTHLELLDINEDCRLPCTEFIAILAAIPGLERLHLREFIKEDEVQRAEEYVAMTNKTHLHLKYLDLSCRLLVEVVQFLCTLILPSSCELHLRLSQDNPEMTPGFQLITSWLSNHFRLTPSFRLFRSHLRSWSIDDTSDTVTDFRVAGSYDSEGEIDEGHLSASLLLWHDSESEAELIENLWVSFLKSLPLSNIVSLEVVCDVMLPDSVWLAVFAPLTTLSTIIINSDYYAAFFRIASPDLSSSVAQPFPALSSVTVTVGCVEDHLSIAHSLDLRLESGFAPLNLVFYTDIIQPHAITRLRESALNVRIYPMSHPS